MNSKYILGGVAVLVFAVVLVIVMNALKTNPEAKPSEHAPAQNTAGDSSPKTAPAASVEKPSAGSTPASAAAAPSPTAQQQQAARPEPASAQSAAAAQNGPAVFGGTWLLDKARSEGLPAGMDQVMTVTPSGGGINFETKLTSARGEEIVREDYALNGREVSFASRWAGGADVNGTRVSRLTADGRGVEVTERATMNTPNGQLTADIKRSWALSPDGKNLTIKMALTSPSIILDNTRLFVKK